MRAVLTLISLTMAAASFAQDPSRSAAAQVQLTHFHLVHLNVVDPEACQFTIREESEQL